VNAKAEAIVIGVEVVLVKRLKAVGVGVTKVILYWSVQLLGTTVNALNSEVAGMLAGWIL